MSCRVREFLILLVLLCGCAAQHEMKVIDVQDAKRVPWAEPKTTFKPTESFLAVIRGYGGHKITLELWRCGTPDSLLHSANYDVPARKTYWTYDGVFFETRRRDLTLVEQETFYWTSTDYVLRFKPLGPGIYELRLASDHGQKESVKFTIGAYR